MFEDTSYIADLGPYQLIGVAGFVVYVLSFAAVQLRQLNGNSIVYSLANILAATLVAISLIADFNLASALIQGSWIIVGFCGLFLRLAQQPTQHTATPSDVRS